MIQFKDRLLELIRQYCDGKSYTQIANEIGITKQLLSNYLIGKNKTISEKKFNLILQWAKQFDSNINADWLRGTTQDKYAVSEDSLNLSANVIDKIKDLSSQNLLPIFHFLLEREEFYNLLTEIKLIEQKIKDNIRESKKYDEEYYEYKLNKSISNLVSSIRNEYKKQYSTYKVKSLLQTKKDSTN